jgi:O-antigen ligase
MRFSCSSVADMAVLQAVVIALIALIVTPGYLFYFDVTPKVAILLLGTAAALVWPGAATSRAPRSFSLLVAASLISLAISTALSPNPALSLVGTNWRRYGMLTQAVVLIFTWLLARNVAAAPQRARTILRAIAMSGAVTAIFGIAQYFGWDPILPKAAYHIGQGIWTIVRPPGTLGYVSYFATWLLAVVFLSLALAAWETSTRIRRACYTTAALAAAAMLLTGTRAAMLGLVAGIAVWLASRGFRISRRVIGAAAVLLFASVAFYYSPPGWQIRSRMRWFVEDPLGGARVHLWRDSVSMAAGRPLGYGPETFTATFPRFESEALARAYPEFLHESPHNIFLDASVSQGIPGLAILAAFCWIGFAAAWRFRKVWLAACLAAVIVSQMFTVFTMPTAMVFYVTIAMAVGVRTQTEARSRHSEVWLRWPLALLLVYAAARLTLADRQLALAKNDLERGDVAAASAHYGDSDKLRFPGTGSDLWYSRACSNLAAKTASPVARVQAMAQAGAAAVRATHTSEEPFNAWYSLSALYAGQNDFANTEKCLRAAIAARPNWFKPHWTLAQVLRLEGRLEEAEREAALGADRNGGKDPEVAHTLDEIRALRATGRVQP